jgi:hypothetical protein
MIAVSVTKATESVAFVTETAIIPGGTANQDGGAGLVVADLIVVRLTPGPAVMIGRLPPPAAPTSDHP